MISELFSAITKFWCFFYLVCTPDSHIEAYARDKSLVKAKLNSIINDSPSMLKFVSDFDSTITTQGSLQSWSAFESSSHMSDHYRAKAYEYWLKYGPIDANTTMTSEEKAPIIAQWTMDNYALMAHEQLPANTLSVILNETKELVTIRNGVSKLIKGVTEAQVPYIAYTAGISNVISHIFSDYATSEYFSVVGNEIGINGNNTAEFISTMPVHIYNKNETTLFLQLGDMIYDRHNTIVLGDSTGDSTIAESSLGRTVLKLGYLNLKDSNRHNKKALIDRHLNYFDIVLVDVDLGNDGVGIFGEIAKLVTGQNNALSIKKILRMIETFSN